MAEQAKKNIKYIHCRHSKAGVVSPHGGLTIAYVLNDNFKVVGWAAAKCNSKDVYNKFIGRTKAAGRLLSDSYYQDCPELDEHAFIQQTHDGYHKAF